jgi:hypothetical protein
MKKLIILLFPFISLIINAQTTYYVAASGGDNGNDGSALSPWATLGYAVTRVKSGDIIYMQAGTHTINATVSIPIGISLTGAGKTSIITTTALSAQYAHILNLTSAALANGNQSISYLKFDGNSLTGSWGISIAKRNNVKIHHCTFVDFNHIAVNWVGDGGTGSVDPYTGDVPPKNYVTGSEFYNNIVTNCSGVTSAPRGALMIGGQDGMLIHDNNMIQTGRAVGANGYVIKLQANGGWIKGMKIYNNILFKDDLDPYDFCIESFHLEGIEIFNNTITGSIDMNFVEKGAYSYGVYIHNNTFGPAAITSSQFRGIILEFSTADVIIRYNRFKNLYTGIYYTPRSGNAVANQEVSYNIFDNIGVIGDYAWGIIRMWSYSENFVLGTFSFYNNVIYGYSVNKPYFGVGIGGFTAGSEINIINNIIVNVRNNVVHLSSLNNLTTLNIKNNIFYNNGNNNAFDLSGTPGTYNNSGNKIQENPNFYSSSNFHPKSGSPAIDAGIPITGLNYDMDGILIGSPPNIGCFETNAENGTPTYQLSVIENSNAKLLTISFDMPLINIIPDRSAFNVIINSQTKNLASIEIIDGKVYITLENAVSYGDIITFSYTIPPDNYLQSVTNIAVASINNMSVLNNVSNKSSGQSALLVIYPNPTSDSFAIKIEGDIPKMGSLLKICSMSGAVVIEKYYPELFPNPIIFNKKLLPGLYLVSLLSDGKVLCASSLVVVN